MELQEISVPSGSEILTLQMQDESPTIWCLCPQSESLIKHKVYCFGTNQQIYTGDKFYIGTVQKNGVWHFFMRNPNVLEL